ncbi:MAG: hypothetical protein L0220_30175 [Acidobacteria bacterium]|nr:hypothetical protein [Acidobacteriota bacterium]
MALRVFSLIICCFSISSLVAAQGRDYLDKSLLSLPTNGSKIRTPKPLAPFTAYRIKVTSSYNLKPVYLESGKVFQSDIVIDGKSYQAISYNQESDGHISSVEFLYRGAGRPIHIGFGNNHAGEIQSAQVEIYIEGYIKQVWREEFYEIWKSYGNWILATALALLPITISLSYFLKRRKRMKDVVLREEKEEQAMIINSQNKRLELMREIDRRAQKKVQEIMARNHDELQRKVMYWRTRAFTESYFLNPELRQNFALANRERIINHLEEKWSQEILEISQDLPLAVALREQEPGVLHWIHARQEVVILAHKSTWSVHPVVEAYLDEPAPAPADNLQIVDANAKLHKGPANFKDGDESFISR